MIGIGIIYPNSLDRSLRHDVVDVRLACSKRSDSWARGKNSRRKKKRGQTRLSLSPPPVPSPRFPGVQLNTLPTYRRALLSERLEQANVRCVWATCSSCVPAQKDIRYSVNIALVKIWTRDKVKPQHVQWEFSLAVKWDQAVFLLRRN